MTVALNNIAMLLSEIITIYLAAAAPVGVAFFLHQRAQAPRGGRERRRRLARATAAALVWPLTLLATLAEHQLNERGAERRGGGKEGDGGRADDCGARVNNARRLLLRSLTDLEECMGELSGTVGEDARRALFVTRERVEQYVGLTQAVSETDPHGSPTARELEPFRVAGRTGDDLLLAGRCVHRRNAARLFKHRARSRAELLASLAVLRETDGLQRRAVQRTDAASVRRASEATVRVYGRAIELCSTLDDWQASLDIARLLDAECTALRRLEAPRRADATAHDDLDDEASDDAARAAREGEICSTPTELRPSSEPASAIRQLPRETTLARG